MASKKLTDLKPGERAKIVSYPDFEDPNLKRHLLCMGFVKGATIEMLKIAPLGDPYEFKIKGYSICLRKEEAQNILVEN